MLEPSIAAGAQGEAVDLRELFERLLFGTYAGKDSYYNDEQIKHGCFERAQELVDVAKRMNIALYTAPPAVAVNEQLLEDVALIAHHGGLIGLSERDALILIRKITVQSHNWKQTVSETVAKLKDIVRNMK